MNEGVRKLLGRQYRFRSGAAGVGSVFRQSGTVFIQCLENGIRDIVRKFLKGVKAELLGPCQRRFGRYARSDGSGRNFEGRINEAVP